MSSDLDDLLNDEIDINVDAIHEAQKIHVIYEIPIITTTTNKNEIELKQNPSFESNVIPKSNDHTHNKTENEKYDDKVDDDDDDDDVNDKTCCETTFVWFYFWFILILILFSYLLTWMIKKSWQNKLEHEYLERMQYISIR